jgi:hypothetical protein
MMQRHIIAVLAALTFVSLGSTAQAENWFTRSCRTFWHDTLSNQAWPRPYVMPDREVAMEHFQLQVAKGWQYQTTLDRQHFSEGTSDLNEAGRLKVYHIMTAVPEQYRTVYVVRSIETQETTTRIDSVQEYIGRVGREAGTVQVVESNLGPTGWPAHYVDLIDRKFETSTPSPRLPAAAGSAGNPSGE